MLCLIGLGAMVAIKAGTSMSPQVVETSPEQTLASKNPSQDTLTKADKLEIAYSRDPVALKPVMLVTKAPDETPPQPISTRATPKIVSRHWHDPNAKKSAAAAPGRPIKSREPKKNKNVDRGKATVDLIRPCRRPEGLARLLSVLNLTPECET
jgi:hypothetical protein